MVFVELSNNPDGSYGGEARGFMAPVLTVRGEARRAWLAAYTEDLQYVGGWWQMRMCCSFSRPEVLLLIWIFVSCSKFLCSIQFCLFVSICRRLIVVCVVVQSDVFFVAGVLIWNFVSCSKFLCSIQFLSLSLLCFYKGFVFYLILFPPAVAVC